ncbi:hypothetical protein T4D_3248 [Trichinella pseudospiralis]|uniref:Uncharacterized protein n=1 Tax=Trichinella pseudospiralis TaxID=6337 RepID=A0A0V1G1M3_TRIPS|nr:hypothetical protein T4D_3248 [Trichinella pseudospiralis]
MSRKETSGEEKDATTSLIPRIHTDAGSEHENEEEET